MTAPYTTYRKFLAETGLTDSLHHFIIWCEQYGDLVIFGYGEE